DISSPPAAASTPEPIPPAAAIINPRRRSRAESGALSYDDFLKVLEGNASRDELYRAFSRFCLSLARRCAVFAVLDERLRCLVLDGPSGVDAKDLVISVRAQSDLAEVCRGHSYYQGPSVDTELGSFYERIGVTAPAEVVAVPIKFSERVGAVGVLDNLDAALHTELNQLFKAVYKLGEALEKLIRERQEHGFRELFSGSPRNRQRESGHRHEAKSPSPVLGQALSPKEMLAELEPESIERSESARQGVADEELLDGEVLELEPEPLELEAQDAEERLTELELLEMDEDQVEAAKAFLQAPPQTLAEIDVVAVESEPGFRLAPKTLAEVDIIAVDAEPGFRAAPKTLAEVDIIAVDADFEEQAKGGFASVPHAPAFTAPEQLDFIDSELEILSHDDDELDAVELEPLPLEAEPEEIDELEHPESDLDFWVVKLDSHDAEVAAKAHRLLSRSAPEHLEALLKRFPGRLRLDRFHFDKEMPVAIQHSRLLGCLVLHGLDAVSALLSLLEGPSVEERFYALLVLGEIRVEGLPRRIWRRIYDKDAQIRRHCAQILRTRVRDASWPEVLELIIDGAQQADDRHAELSLNALAIVRDFKAMGAIIPLVEHGNRRVAEAALQAAMGTALTDLGASAKRWERWLDENRNSNRMQLIAEAMVHKERHIRALAAEEIAEIPGIMLNYHPDAHRREQAKAREVFLEWNSNHDGGFRSHLGSGLGRTLRGGRERE
ncbi:MAG: hypothetical protein RBU37_08680, partial [Myxococcota bacterium]|nr:hypothetical protein [Myxococcota bacterium]